MKVYNQDLVLYYFPSCPYCKKVIKCLYKYDIEIKMKNIQKDKVADKELVDIGGKRQVPCLFIEGQPLYESNDIIAWFKNNYLN